MLFISLSRLGGITVPTVNELLDRAKNEIQYLQKSEVFLLRDLFKCYEWNRISRSDRLLLGILFLYYVKTEVVGVIAIEKTSSGQQKYQANHGSFTT